MTEPLLPALNLRLYGDISERFVADVKDSLLATYAVARGPKPEVIDVRVVDGLLTLKELCEMEGEEGIEDRFGDEGYLTAHELRNGRSRITICWQRADELPPPVSQAALQHEAGHSILHATEGHGAFALTTSQLRRARSGQVSLAVLRSVVRLAAEAVKDFEVARLLADAGLRAAQTALAVHRFAEVAKERPPWESVARTAAGRIVYAADHLRPLLYTEPLQASDTNLSEISGAIREGLSAMSEDAREELISLSAFLAEELGDETHANVEQTTDLLIERFAELSA